MEEEILEEELSMNPSVPQIKLLLLKSRETYLIGTVTELDEEPSILVENCYEIVECGEYGADAESLKQKASKIEGKYHQTSLQLIDENDGKDWWALEYIILKPYPKYSSQRDLFLTSDAIFTILDPEPGVLDLYRKVAG